MIQYVKVARKNLLDSTKPDKTYAVAQARDTMEIADLAKHMNNHGSPFSRGTITAVITDMVSCCRELLLDGYILHLGDLGNFNVTLKSKGIAESVPDSQTGEKPTFSASDITAVNTKYTPGTGFADLIADATFEETISKADKAAQIKENNEGFENGTRYDSSGSSSSSESSEEPVDNE